MKVRCPNCGAVGRVPEARIPPSGANIRCPSCAFVFPVGGPEGTNVVDHAAAAAAAELPAMGQTQSLPLPSPEALASARERVRAAAPQPEAPVEPPVAPGNHDDPEASSGLGALPRPSEDPGSGHGNPAAAEPEPSPDPGPGTGGGSHPDADSGMGTADARAALRGGSSRYLMAGGSAYRSISGGHAAVGGSDPAPESPSLQQDMRAALGGLLGAAAAPPSPPIPAPMPADTGAPSPPEPSASGPPAARGGARLVQARSDSGITYDFPDLDGLRRWLQSRASFEDVSVCLDGSGDFERVEGFAELADIRPMGPRRSTGSMPAIPLEAPRRTTGTATSTQPGTSGRQTQTGSGSTTGRFTSPGGRTAQPPAVEPEEGPRRIPLGRALIYAAFMATVVLTGVLLFLNRTPTGPRIPNTPAGQQLRWVMETINPRSPAPPRPAVDARFAPDTVDRYGQDIFDRINHLRTWRAEYELVQIHSEGSSHIHAVLTTEGGEQGHIVLRTEEQPPHRITTIQIGRGQAPQPAR